MNKFEQYKNELEKLNNLYDTIVKEAEEFASHEGRREGDLYRLMFGDRVQMLSENKVDTLSRLNVNYYNEWLKENRNNLMKVTFDDYYYEDNLSIKKEEFNEGNLEKFSNMVFKFNDKNYREFISDKIKKGTYKNGKLKISLYGLYNHWNGKFDGYSDCLNELLMFMQLACRRACTATVPDFDDYREYIASFGNEYGQVLLEFPWFDLKVYKNQNVDIIIKEEELKEYIENLF